VTPALTEGEPGLLALIQAHHGMQNSPEDVFWSEANEAVLAVKDSCGSVLVMANLTNLAQWHEDGTLSTEQLYAWLRLPRP